MRITPTRRALLLFAAGLPVALLPALVSASLWPVWLAWVAALVLLIGADLALGLPRRRLQVQLDLPDVLYIGSPEPLPLRLGAPARHRGLRLTLRAEHDPDLSIPDPPPVTLGDDGLALSELPVAALRRGTSTLHALWLSWTGPLGLVHRTLRHPVDAPLRVVPNIRAVRAAALRIFSDRELTAGLKAERHLGDGSEFDALREYQPGLDHRAIDWKASARHVKLLTREFRAERNHQVVLALDTGHLMGQPDTGGGIPRLDGAINAALLLAYVALKTGDRVGLFAFDDQVRLFAEPQGGVATVHRLQHLTSGLDYGPAETNFTLGLTTLLSRLRRRSLVVVFTDFVDTVTAELMADNLGRLARRHLVLFASLSDPGLAALAEAPPASLSDLNQAVVARDFLRERDLVLRRLRRAGIHCIDAPAARVSADLVSRYLDVKRRELV